MRILTRSCFGLVAWTLLAATVIQPQQPAQPQAAAATHPSSTPVHGAGRYQIDHVFVMADPDVLTAHGPETADFLWWPQLTPHAGQGTTGGYFYFDNAYLEFLAVTDPDEARQNALNTGVNLVDRGDWKSRPGVSPIGIGIRDTREGDDGVPGFPDGLDRYDAGWMQGAFSLWLTPAARDLSQPWTFILPFAQTGAPRDWMGPRAARLLEHPGGARLLTDLLIVLPPEAPPSATLRTLEADGALRLQSGDAYRLELTFDHGRSGRTLDLRPQGHPVVIRY